MAVSLIFLIMSLIFLIMMITEATLVIMVSIDPSMAGRELSGGTVALQRPQQHRTSRKVPRQRVLPLSHRFFHLLKFGNWRFVPSIVCALLPDSNLAF